MQPSYCWRAAQRLALRASLMLRISLPLFLWLTGRFVKILGPNTHAFQEAREEERGLCTGSR